MELLAVLKVLAQVADIHHHLLWGPWVGKAVLGHPALGAPSPQAPSC